MAKEKVTLTLESETLASLRKLVGARSLSAEVERAVTERIAKLRHLAAVDELLRDLEYKHGPIPSETIGWAASQVAEWSASVPPKRKRTG
jgi:hypothetical protein